MTRPKLNEDTIKKLPVPDRGNRVTYFAGDKLQGLVAPPGFGVRVTKAGVRAFILNYRVGGRERRITIGMFPTWSALRALREGRELRQRIDRGEDPLAERDASRAPEPKTKTIADLLDEHVERYVNKNQLRSAANIKSAFERLVKPRIGGKGVYELRRSDVVMMLDEIEDENGPVMADHTLASVRKAFNWYATRDDQFIPPIVSGMARTKPTERARSRILADDEIRDLWEALDIIATETVKTKPWLAPYPRYVKVLLLTGARRDEVGGMTWDEISNSGDVWTVPAARYKTKLDHEVPVTDVVRALIGTRDGHAGRFVFNNGGRAGFRTHAWAKKVLEAEIAKLRAARGAPPADRWTLHDLRRTARSLMSRARVPTDHAERAIGHVPAGVRRVYDRHQYTDEKRAALETLAALVERILHPPSGNVAHLDEKRVSRGRRKPSHEVSADDAAQSLEIMDLLARMDWDVVRPVSVDAQTQEEMRRAMIAGFGEFEQVAEAWFKSIGAERVPYPPGGKDAYTFGDPKKRLDPSRVDTMHQLRAGWEALRRAAVAPDDEVFTAELFSALQFYLWKLAQIGAASLRASIQPRGSRNAIRDRKIDAAYQKFRRDHPKGSVEKFIGSSHWPSDVKELDTSTVMKIIGTTRKIGN
jgi:integrase